MIYKVAPDRVVWSNQHQKLFYEGEALDLSHASGSDIASLLASGAVIEVDEKPVKETKKEKVNHG